MKKILIFASFLALASPIFTQQVNPNTQIGWPTNCSTPGYVYSYQAKLCIPGAGGGVSYPSPTVNAIPMVVDATAPGTLGNSGLSSDGTGGVQGYSGTVGNPNPEWEISPYAYPGGFDFSTNTFDVPGGRIVHGHLQQRHRLLQWRGVDRHVTGYLCLLVLTQALEKLIPVIMLMG